MAKNLYTNNAYSTLASGITDSVLLLTVAAGHGARFPNPTGANYFYCTLINTSNVVEIVKVTARSTDAFTIVRAQDGTSGTAFSSGDRVELRVVNAGLVELEKDILHDRKTATYTALLADHGTLIEMDSASGVDLVLTAAATLGEGWWVDVHVSGAGTITVNPDGAELIDDAATITADEETGFRIICDGAAFWTIGKATGFTGFESTTRMLFHQTAAPTGWTKDTTASLNDNALRITTGTVTPAGSDDFSTVFGAAINTAGRTLSEAQLATHAGHVTATGTNTFSTDMSGTAAIVSVTTGNKGSNTSHNHAMTMDLSYQDVIIASKD